MNPPAFGAASFSASVRFSPPKCRKNLFCVALTRRSKVRFAPPFLQKVTLGSPVQLQAPSQRLTVATNFLRAAKGDSTAENAKDLFRIHFTNKKDGFDILAIKPVYKLNKITAESDQTIPLGGDDYSCL